MSDGCSYCGLPGCSIDTCPERLQDRYGTPGDQEGEADV